MPKEIEVSAVPVTLRLDPQTEHWKGSVSVASHLRVVDLKNLAPVGQDFSAYAICVEKE